MQLLDEVPMIWGSCYMIYCMHMVRIIARYYNKFHIALCTRIKICEVSLLISICVETGYIVVLMMPVIISEC